MVHFFRSIFPRQCHFLEGGMGGDDQIEASFKGIAMTDVRLCTSTDTFLWGTTLEVLSCYDGSAYFQISRRKFQGSL